MSYWTQVRGTLLLEHRDISIGQANKYEQQLKNILGPTYSDIEKEAEKKGKKPDYKTCTLPVGSEDSVEYFIHKNLYKKMAHNYTLGKETLQTFSSFVDVSFIGHLRDFGVKKEHQWKPENNPEEIVRWMRKVTDEIARDITSFFTFIIRYEADDEDSGWILQNMDTNSFRTQEIIRIKVPKSDTLRII